MEKKIKALLTLLKIEFYAMWVIVIGLIAGYECGILEEGVLIGNDNAIYVAQLTGVLLAICLIPMSLRIFNLSLTKYIKTLNIENALKSYRRWSEVRIILLLVVAVFNISLYYWTMDNTGLLCGGMAVLASMFCIPGRKRILSELDLTKEEEEDV